MVTGESVNRSNTIEEVGNKSWKISLNFNKEEFYSGMSKNLQ